MFEIMRCDDLIRLLVSTLAKTGRLVFVAEAKNPFFSISVDLLMLNNCGFQPTIPRVILLSQ